MRGRNTITIESELVFHEFIKNEREILKYISHYGNITADKIHSHTSIPKSEVIKIVKNLCEEGFICIGKPFLNTNTFDLLDKFTFELEIDEEHSPFDIAAKLVHIGNITECHATFGQFPLKGVFYVMDNEQCLDVIREIESIEGVNTVNVDYVMETVIDRSVGTNALFYKSVLDSKIRPIEKEEKRSGYLYQKYLT